MQAISHHEPHDRDAAEEVGGVKIKPQPEGTN
jgi:hypothetical protein